MTVDKIMSNKDLLEACYRGDEAAISLFYDRYKDLVYSAIHRWMDRYAKNENREEHIAELFQQAFLELIDNGFAKLKQARDQDKPAALIFLIAQQCAGRYFKARWKEGRRRAKEVEWPAAGGGLSRHDRELINTFISSFLNTLGETELQVFDLRFGDGLKYEDISERTGLTTDNVGVMISRIKERFRDSVREKCPSIERLL